MSIWSRVAARFSPSPEEIAARKIIREVLEKGRAEAVIQPIAELVLAIVSLSWECTEALIPHLRSNRQMFKLRDEQIMYVFCEFLYFFMHIMNRHARSRLSLQRIKMLQELVEPRVVRPAVVEAFVGDWSVELKNGVERDLYQKLRETDVEYLSRTDELLARSGDYPVPAIYSNLRIELALSTVLARTVIGLAGYDIDTSSPSAEVTRLGALIGSQVMGALSTGSLKAFGELVEKANAAIESSPTLPQVFREHDTVTYGASPFPKGSAAQPFNAAVATHGPRSGVRILVVDDEGVVEAKLASEYFEVLSAHNGPSALEIAEAELPDIILLDVMMPRMDGFEVCRRLKVKPLTADIPVVMVTALSNVADRLRGLEAGADDFLTKPVNDTALFARVRSLVRLKRMMDEVRLREEVCGRFSPTDTSEGPTADLNAVRVLLVEEQGFAATRIIDMLTPVASSVVRASSCAEAQSLLDDSIELVIASLSMPDGDPLRLVSQWRANEVSRQLPILLMADDSELMQLAKGLDLGANDYLTRPIDRSELLARVRTQISRNRVAERLREIRRSAPPACPS
jgi:DNA-binding response OmpR family regulator